MKLSSEVSERAFIMSTFSNFLLNFFDKINISPFFFKDIFFFFSL